ncbi:sensor domain-containing protein [Cellulomonas cellasea]|uniref:PknH-like extracellular domain-containing protein n=2 Tax=Cellulomonas cellasea TaxID=43670 RepID=A0A0A0BAV4_9CELL|nr:sensor domain-containing protein [Cellulomonas cellasea]KGM02964.1 hypothetical protein Q760_10390 [Cellulomonas cellasea DSM 20118]GEA89413.1 hypothetical protein CCE01nite_33620 [Cellulomonas cellasea]
MPVDVAAVPPHRRARRWPWWVVGVLLVLAGASGVAARPWASAGPLPFPSPSVSAGSTTAAPTVLPTVQAPQFDAASAATLLLTREELEEALPGADPLAAWPVLPWAWGIPEGSRVEPERCTVARTVVSAPPVVYDVRGWDGPSVRVRQEVVVVADQGAAADAFRTLVATVDSCPAYAQVNQGVDGASWTGEPATEAQGRFPSLWQEIEHTAEGATVPGYRGHLLVGNAVVTWNAEVIGGAGRAEVVDLLGEGAALEGIVQRRASEAAAALQTPAEGAIG